MRLSRIVNSLAPMPGRHDPGPPEQEEDKSHTTFSKANPVVSLNGAPSKETADNCVLRAVKCS